MKIQDVLKSNILRWIVAGVIAAVLIFGFIEKSKELQNLRNTVLNLQSERDRIQERNDELNAEIDAMKVAHAEAVTELNEQLIAARMETEKIQVASLEKISEIRESVMKSWEERFDMLEQEYFAALEKINAQQKEIVLRNRLIDTMSLQLRDWIDKDAERRALMDDCTARLSESIGLNEEQAAEIARLSRKVKLWKVVGIIAGGYLVWRAVK